MSDASSPTTTTPRGKKWDAKAYPYPVDYCDHFETPLQAYKDIAPIVDELFFSDSKNNSSSSSKKKKRKRTFTNRSDIRVYDPYYCNGQAAVLLQNELGYTAVHEKRDFYKDIERGTVPSHDILITNPPYSDQHKKQCLDFCLKQLQTHRRPFCILMPNYVAARQYYRTALQARAAVDAEQPHQHKNSTESVVYLVPQTRYMYHHPEGTGKMESPFASLWFLGIGAENVQRIQIFWNEKQQQSTAELVTSLEHLSRHPEFASCFQKRPNPRQRQHKKRKTASQQQQQNDSLVSAAKLGSSTMHRIEAAGPSPNKKKKMSKYRNSEGKREKRRF